MVCDTENFPHLFCTDSNGYLRGPTQIIGMGTQIIRTVTADYPRGNLCRTVNLCAEVYPDANQR